MYLPLRELKRIYYIHVSDSTIRRMVNNGTLRIAPRDFGEHRFYLQSDFEHVFQRINTDKSSATIGYARVSSRKQIPDLKRQEQDIRSQYPDILMIIDHGFEPFHHVQIVPYNA